MQIQHLRRIFNIGKKPDGNDGKMKEKYILRKL